MSKIKKEPKSIYIIKNLENGRIKIGISENIKSRFENLVCASGCKLELLYVSKKKQILPKN